ncbi:MAG: hypothetical protein GX631_03635, partial [Dehalococcoidales bacterium]|nr:hypothetical protein [Dehalococcoidales bacterium]
MNNSDTKGKHDLNRKIRKYTIILLIIGCSLTGISLWLLLNPNPLVILPNDVPVMILDIESSRNVDSDRLEVY